MIILSPVPSLSPFGPLPTISVSPPLHLATPVTTLWVPSFRWYSDFTIHDQRSTSLHLTPFVLGRRLLTCCAASYPCQVVPVHITLRHHLNPLTIYFHIRAVICSSLYCSQPTPQSKDHMAINTVAIPLNRDHVTIPPIGRDHLVIDIMTILSKSRDHLVIDFMTLLSKSRDPMVIDMNIPFKHVKTEIIWLLAL